MTVWRVTQAACCEPCRFSSGGLFLQEAPKAPSMEVPPPVNGSTLQLRGLSLALSNERGGGLRGERLTQIAQLLPLVLSSPGSHQDFGLLGL